jgi:hypothetical protein
MSEQFSLATVAGWRGKTLISSDGVKVGRIREVIYDLLSEEPVGCAGPWLQVGGR